MHQHKAATLNVSKASIEERLTQAQLHLSHIIPGRLSACEQMQLAKGLVELERGLAMLRRSENVTVEQKAMQVELSACCVR